MTIIASAPIPNDRHRNLADEPTIPNLPVQRGPLGNRAQIDDRLSHRVAILGPVDEKPAEDWWGRPMTDCPCTVAWCDGTCQALNDRQHNRDVVEVDALDCSDTSATKRIMASVVQDERPDGFTDDGRIWVGIGQSDDACVEMSLDDAEDFCLKVLAGIQAARKANATRSA